MRVKIYISVALLSLFAVSCSVQRFLPPGERLYRGATITVQKPKETTTSAKSLRSTLELAATPKPNKYLFGQPYRVWFWYKIGQPKSDKGLKAFLRNRLGEAPVFASRVNTTATASNMVSLLTNLGYFHSAAQGDTTHSGGYFVKAHYTAQVLPQYHIDSITWVKDSTPLLNLLQTNSQRRGVLKTGKSYNLADITAERDRLDLFLKTRGYYYFNPDYLMAYADTTVGNRKVNLYLSIKKKTPATARFPYTINSINVFPHYTLAPGQLDTVRRQMEQYDSINIRDPRHRYKPSLFARTVIYRPGAIYNSREQNTTLNRFINLGAFKFVKNHFEAVKTDSLAGDTTHRLNVFYYLTPEKKHALQGELDGFSRENNYVGTEASVNWKDRNAFRGAEQLGVKVYGGLETSSGNAVRNTNFRLGSEVSLKVPRYVTPFFRIRENNFYPPSTNFLMGYEYYRQDIFYTKNLFRFQYGATWKPNLQKEYTINPVALSYLSATGITDSFRVQEAANPSLQLTVNSEAILGTSAIYSYNSDFRTKKNKVFFSSGIDLSGNVAGLITGAHSFRSKNIFSVPFAQYVKFDEDYHYTRRLSNGDDWANRLMVGIGIPYNNSRLLPFTKLYTIGGSNSIRGFRSRTLGPGTYLPTAQDQRLFQLIGGDFKLLGNTELRIPLNKIVSTALFVDAGNIWTKDTVLFGPKAQLTKDFYKQIAVATGVGLRFDITVLLIRVDLGMPVRKPYLPEGEQWVLNKINFGSAAWRRDNLILNIAIGLPF